MHSGYSGYSGYKGLRYSKHYEPSDNQMERIKRDGGFWWRLPNGTSGWSGYSGTCNYYKPTWYQKLWNFICKLFKKQS